MATEPVLILGCMGYTGWPLTCELLDRGYDVVGVDNNLRRELADPSVTPIANSSDRIDAVDEAFDGQFDFREFDVGRVETLQDTISEVVPETIVNLAQIPAAPYSMQGFDESWHTQRNNNKAALALLWALHDLDRTDTPVVQLATMGEYGTPEQPIPEGFLDDGRPAPKLPGSFYHASKVHMTINAQFAARTWEQVITEIYQGIVYGVSMFEDRDERLMTRFDVDETFGTVLNRFTAQAAVGQPLTVYGKGGQMRAMLPLPDVIHCLCLAIENPPSPEGPGRYPYRAVNQFEGAYRVREIAEMVADHTGAEIEHIANPRVEDDSEHYFDPEREVLDALGYEPVSSLEEEFKRSYRVVQEHTDRIDVEGLYPTTAWN